MKTHQRFFSRAAMTLALMLLTTATAWADITINSATDWDTFATNVSNGTSYSGETVTLANDITVSTMAGSSQTNSFKGTFDGGEHTLTFNYIATDQYAAPFAYIDGATIQNLHVNGTIQTSAKYAAGIAAQEYGTTHITNCRSSIVVKSSVDNNGDHDGTHGGFVAVNNSGTLTIEGCVFDGKLLTTNGTNNCGGFVGWKGGTLNITNSIYNPAEIATGETEVLPGDGQYMSKTFARTDANITNCFYTRILGSAQGKQPRNITAGNNVTIESIALTGTSTNYSVSGITAYSGGGLNLNGTLYYGNGDNVNLTLSTTLPEPYDYRATGGTLSGNSNPYTLTMPDADVTISAVPFIYEISNQDDWVVFCAAVNCGHDYSNETVTLAGDVTVGTENNPVSGPDYMAGTSDHKFKGTFFGGGHTLTFNATATADNCAPFGYIDGATITCLNVAGTIRTGYKYAAGIAAHSYGNSIIQNCHSSVTINTSIGGDGTHAGFVAVHESGATLNISNCLFDGSITGANTTNCGGLVGWRNGTLTFNNCLQNGTLSIKEESGSATYNRNGSSTLNNCYYKTAYGDVQGTQTTATGSDLQTLLGSGWQVSGSSVVPIMDSKNLAIATVSGISNFYLYTGNKIAVNYTVTAADGTALTKGTHYTETLSPSTVLEKGEYTLTISGTGSYTGSQTFRFFVGEGTPVTSSTTTMTTGTYVAAGDVTIGSRIYVSGDVRLILWDGCTMNATKGINVFSGNSLTIDAQSTGGSMGKLIATANDKYHAGIGGNLHNNGGAITINGGEITASGAEYGAGIGGGMEKVAGTITINGGKVTATGGGWGAGIGSGLRGSCGTITINGGKVTANGGYHGAGIGRGSDGSGGTIQLSYTKAVNSIYASSYGADAMSIAAGKTFTDGNGNTYTSDTPSSTLLGIAGKTLTPAIIFNVTVGDCPNTTVTVQDKAVEGETVDFTVTHNEGYCLLTVTYNSSEIVPEDGIYSFTMPAADVTISTTIAVIDWATVTDGSAKHPYVIYNKDQLDMLAQRVNSGNDYNGKHFQLGADIAYDPDVLTIDNDNNGVNESNYTPIGTYSKPFKGYFDGQNHMVSGIRIVNGGTSYQSLFGYIGDNMGTKSEVKNVILADAHITGYEFTSGIVGYNDHGRVTNCHVLSDVTIHANQADSYYHGGIVGYNTNYGEVTGCTSAANITYDTNSGPYYGGVVGYSMGSVSNCLYLGSVLNGRQSVGAIVGKISGGSVSNCYYTDTHIQGKQSWATIGNDACAVGVSSGGTVDATTVGLAPQDTKGNSTFLTLMAQRNAALTAVERTTPLSTAIDVTLNGRTLFKDGAWNTLCLPFDVSTTSGILAGDDVQAMTLITSTSGLDGTTLTLNFTEVSPSGEQGGLIPAGTPFIIKWATPESPATDLVNPTFSSVTVNNSASTEQSFAGGKFVGNYSPVPLSANDKSVLFLGGNNSLYWPETDITVNACRAYFELSDGNAQVKSFVLNFGEDEATEIKSIDDLTIYNLQFEADAWFSIDGRRLNGKPSKAGIYIHGNRKVVIK